MYGVLILVKGWATRPPRPSSALFSTLYLGSRGRSIELALPKPHTLTLPRIPPYNCMFNNSRDCLYWSKLTTKEPKNSSNAQ